MALFVVILFTFVITVKTIGQSRYFHPAPETIYLDLGTQTVQASVAIVQPESQIGAPNG